MCHHVARTALSIGQALTPVAASAVSSSMGALVSEAAAAAPAAASTVAAEPTESLLRFVCSGAVAHLSDKPANEWKELQRVSIRRIAPGAWCPHAWEHT